VRVERRVLPVTSDEDRRIEVFERELWRIAVEHLPYGEQIQWAALAGARVAPSGWRRARAMLHFDREGAIRRAFLLTAVQRNKNTQLRVRALQEIAASRDAEAFDQAIDDIGTWTREERREGTKVMLLALAEKRIGRRDQANAWIWRLAGYTRDVHEEYAVQRWPETKRLLGLLVNSSGSAHARNARRLVHAARKQDRRLSAALLAAAIAHSPEGEEILRGARTRMARKPSALSRELLRNFPKSRGRRGNRRRRKKGGAEGGEGAPVTQQVETAARSRQSRRSRNRGSRNGAPVNADPREAQQAESSDGAPTDAPSERPTPRSANGDPTTSERRSRPRRRCANGAQVDPAAEAQAVEAIAAAAAALAAARADTPKPAAEVIDAPALQGDAEAAPKPKAKRTRSPAKPKATAQAKATKPTAKPKPTKAAAKPKAATKPQTTAKPKTTKAAAKSPAKPRPSKPKAAPAPADDDVESSSDFSELNAARA